MTITEARQAVKGSCSQCHKIWTLPDQQGVCQWCGKQAHCQTEQSARQLKSRARKRPEAVKLDYTGLAGDWQTYYKVASTYEPKIPLQDRDDWRHDCMLELDKAQQRDGKPLPELRAYRIASLMVSLYYRQLNGHSERVCILNGYPQRLHCKNCQHKTQGKRCDWLAVRPLADLDGVIVDNEGYETALLDTVASEDIRDMPDLWYDLNQLKGSLPTRLVEIGYKRLEGKTLTGAERKYLCKALKQAQKKLL